MLAFTDVTLAVKFFAAEVGVFLVYKILRRDFYWWIRVEGVLSVILSLLVRVVVKVISDFTGCVHLRNPLEMGGLAYSVSMIWAQIMPFVALGWYEGGNKEQMQILLLGSFGVWLFLNGLFFCSIDRSFMHTFFGTKTGPEYIVELFRTSTIDSAKFRAAFSKRRSYINEIEDEVREWLRENIGRFQLEKPEWWNIEIVGDEFLPQQVRLAEGGSRRRKSLVKQFTLTNGLI